MISVSLLELVLYTGGLLILFLTPGPVWIAIVARSLSGGVKAAWPLAFGVALGDAIWPLLAIFGITQFAGTYGEYLIAFEFLACLIFIIMGTLLIVNAKKSLSQNARLSRPGFSAGFLAGVAVILGNPKAILFYMGVLPGFFDLTRFTTTDVIIVVLISAILPMSGNLSFALMVGQVRGLLQSSYAIRCTNLISGGLMICVGLLILVI